LAYTTPRYRCGIPLGGGNHLRARPVARVAFVMMGRHARECPSGGTTMAIVLSVAGMILAFVGSGLAALAVLVNEQTATALASTRWDFNEPLKRAIQQQSRAAAIGLGLVAAGTLLQIIGTVLQA